MAAQKLSTVFFGSGPVALESLNLLANNFELEAIITKPATLQQMHDAFPEVPVFAVSRRTELDKLCTSRRFTSKLGVVIDFGVIIGDAAIDSFELGIVNSHFSLLPQWRGVDPITFAILSGQSKTGVSLMLIVRAWDEGPLLAQSAYKIPSGMTTPQLTHALIMLSNAMLAEVVPRYINGDIAPQDQLSATIGPKEPSYSRKLTKEDGRLDWTKPAIVLEREIRAYVTWPKSYTNFAGREVVVLSSKVVSIQGQPGTISADKNHLVVHCGENSLEILEIKPAGKPAMSSTAFLAGYRKYL